VHSLQREMALNFAKALVEAERAMEPAKIAFGQTTLLGVTRNRRAKESPYLNTTTIDPHVALIRVDSATGAAPTRRLATVWNFAIHGVCYGPSNMKFSGDIMGVSNRLIEARAGGVALFVNGDAGDIDPAAGMCDNAPLFVGSGKMADAVLKHTATMIPTNVDVKFKVGLFVDVVFVLIVGGLAITGIHTLSIIWTNQFEFDIGSCWKLSKRRTDRYLFDLSWYRV
jgi:hypothetical protein